MYKSVGIITFHWAANHGAILQTYASMAYLQSIPYVSSVQVIDYQPANFKPSLVSLLKPGKPRAVLDRIRNYIKGRKLSKFRNEHLVLTKLYSTEKDLLESPPLFDIYFSGSDQIWNPSFTQNGEGGPTGSYFLSFAPINARKAALSVSFGVVNYPIEASEIAKPLIDRYDFLSVREKTGFNILSEMGYKDVQLVADPTVLLTVDQYRKLYGNKHATSEAAICILRNQSKQNRKHIRSIVKQLGIKKTKNISYVTMEEWLAAIDQSNIVVTNSFHCVMMALKFHTAFWVIPEDGNRAGMNDRLETLLECVGLLNRIIKIGSCVKELKSPIDWKKVDEKMLDYSMSLHDYLDRVIME